MEQKQKVFKWLSVVFLGAGFLTYVAYLFCRKPSGMTGAEYDHISWFVVDVFMIGGALLGLLKPERFEKLGGFCIVGLSFANLVLSAVEDTGSIFLVNNPKISDQFTLWVDFFIGIVSLIAIASLIVSLALPKTWKVLGLLAIIAFTVSGILILVEGIAIFVAAKLPWAFGINLVAVSVIIFGLVFGLLKYAYLLEPQFAGKK